MKYPKFKVCVRCFTYNQANYIEETMNGLAMQQTDFPFICCIVDDASVDGEQKVIENYINKNFLVDDSSAAFTQETDYAQIIYAQHKNNSNCFFAVLYLKHNHYSQGKKKIPYLKEWRDNAVYEAICEGDDYWVVPDKLQWQVKFLDEHLDYGLVYTKAFLRIQNREVDCSHTIGEPGCHSFDEMIAQNPVPTLTTLFRKSIYEKFIQSITPNPLWKMGDYPMWLFFALQSKIHFIDTPTAVYRVLPKSASHSTNLKKRLQFVRGVYLVRKDLIKYAGRKDLQGKCRKKYWREVLMISLHQMAVVLRIK